VKNNIASSRGFKSKNTLNKSVTREMSLMGMKSYQPSIVSRRKASTAHFSFHKLDSSLNLQKFCRQNTEEIILNKKKEMIPQMKKSVKMHPRMSKVSMSNLSLMSIQKDMNTSTNMLNSLIVKSPTLARNRRKSSFLNRLPETLRRVMNLNVSPDVSQNISRRSSLLSGLALKPVDSGNEEEEELSAIASEESIDSNHKESEHKVIFHLRFRSTKLNFIKMHLQS
jgi:hypothetical protein